MNFKQRLKKRSRTSLFFIDVSSITSCKKGYKIQVFMSLRCFFAKKSDVLKIKKHPMGHSVELILKDKNYDFI